MLFTREPIIETIISARSGFRLVVRSSKQPGEELLVDAVEVVSFGHSLFYRCTERPKAFLVPVGDYEIGEVRETRLVLKHLAQSEPKSEARAERSEARRRESKAEVRAEPRPVESPQAEPLPSEAVEAKEGEAAGRNERRRERRRQRRRRGEGKAAGPVEPAALAAEEEPAALPEEASSSKKQRARGSMQLVSALIPPPPTLVSDIFRYERLDNDGVREAVEQADRKQAVEQARSGLIETLDLHGHEEGKTK